MKKRMVLFFVFLLTLAVASVACADALDPFSRPRPRPPEPAPPAPPAEVHVSLEPSPDGRQELALRFTLPGPGSYAYTLFSQEADEIVQSGSAEVKEENAPAREERFTCPTLAANEAHHYILTVDFSLVRERMTAFGRKREEKADEERLVRYIEVNGTDEGATLHVSENGG